MWNKKKYYLIFEKSKIEFEKLIANLSKPKSLIQPRLEELSQCFEGEYVLVKVLIAGTLDEEFCKHLYEILITTPPPPDFPATLMGSGHYFSTHEINDTTVHVAWDTIVSASSSYIGNFDGHLGIIAFTKELNITDDDLELTTHLLKGHARVRLLTNGAKSPYGAGTFGILSDWRNYKAPDAALQFLLNYSALEYVQIYNALLNLETLFLETIHVTKQIEQLNSAHLKLISSPSNIPKNDPLIVLKGILREEISQAERNFKNDLDIFFASNGPYVRQMTASAGTLNRLEIIEKSKKNLFAIYGQTYTIYQEFIKKVLTKKHTDLTEISNKIISRLVNTINMACQQKLTVHIDFHINELDIDKEFPIDMDTNYQASGIRGGFIQLLTASRGFAMTFIMWFGIIGSVFGFAIRGFEYYPLILISVLCSGFLFVIREQKKEFKELQNDNITGAQNHLNDQALKVGQATAVKWRTLFSDYLRNIEKQITEQIEDTIRNQNREREKTERRAKQFENRITESNNEFKIFFTKNQNRDNYLDKIEKDKAAIMKDMMGLIN